ncbi:hypothetical protein SRIMM317S_01905 [Streptomyces rimosus subsp. rimosus]
MRSDSTRGTNVAGKTHTNRASTTTTNTMTAYQTASPPPNSPSPRSTTGSCRPISANTDDSSTKETIFHTASSWSRVSKSTCHDRCPR